MKTFEKVLARLMRSQVSSAPNRNVLTSAELRGLGWHMADTKQTEEGETKVHFQSQLCCYTSN